MPSKKKTTSKKPEALKKCLRSIDSTTVAMSDDPKFPEYKVSPEKLAKGLSRVDASTVVKTGK